MPGLTDRLGGLSPEELRAFFSDNDAGTITRLIHDAPDAELGTLVADDDVRAEAVLAILSRFPEFADRDRLAGIEGVVCFDLARAGGPNECHTARFSGGSVEILADETARDVTIGADIVDFVRLVTGQRNAALLYLADELAVDGDAMLALAVGTVFQVPDTRTAVVDPSALDPVDVATAVARTSARHMREVMADGFRDIVLDEVFRRSPTSCSRRRPERSSSPSASGSAAGRTARSTGTSYTWTTAAAGSTRTLLRVPGATRPSPSTG